MRDPETGGRRKKSRCLWQTGEGRGRVEENFELNVFFFQVNGVARCLKVVFLPRFNLLGLLAAAVLLGHNCFRMSRLARKGAAARRRRPFSLVGT